MPKLKKKKGLRMGLRVKALGLTLRATERKIKTSVTKQAATEKVRVAGFPRAVSCCGRSRWPSDEGITSAGLTLPFNLRGPQLASGLVTPQYANA